MLSLHPTLVDLREQYPICDLAKVHEMLATGAPIRRSDIPTLDFIGTFLQRDGSLSYFGYSVKPSDTLKKLSVTKRLQRNSIFAATLDGDGNL